MMGNMQQMAQKWGKLMCNGLCFCEESLCDLVFMGKLCSPIETDCHMI